ncbi:hypothetical protein HDU93_001666 [Gonapodya sp. JEL0774]|nr:hypothetical protein HDU93_001666 [Gonapodya sp. JEL0774]
MSASVLASRDSDIHKRNSPLAGAESANGKKLERKDVRASNRLADTIAHAAEVCESKDDTNRDENPIHINVDGRLRDFIWVGYPEPHAARRTAMLKKYPEIKSLMRPEPSSAIIIVILVAIQLYFARYVSITPGFLWSSRFWALTYVVGGIASGSLLLAVHEVTHFLAFKSPNMNKALAMLANIPIVFPFCVEFKKFHMDHHRFQGVDGIDGDIPTELEAWLLDNFFGKLFFLTFQIFFYAFRPLIAANPISYRTPMNWYLSSVVFQAASMALVWRAWGWPAILYLLLSVFLGASLHPMAGHFIAEHFVTDKEAITETYSYYGMWNLYVETTV